MCEYSKKNEYNKSSYNEVTSMKDTRENINIIRELKCFGDDRGRFKIDHELMRGWGIGGSLAYNSMLAYESDDAHMINTGVSIGRNTVYCKEDAIYLK
jgi:hypothetical protein